MIEEREWESIYAAIERSNGRSEIAEGTVIDHDPDGEHVYVAGFGSEPVAIAALDYSSAIYTGAIRNSVRAEPVKPEIGQRVLVARPGGSMHRPRLLGVVREDLKWQQPNDVQSLEIDDAGNAFVQGTLYAYRGVEVERVSEFDSAFKSWKDGDSTPPRFQIRADGRLEWGSGTAAFDTNLYRSVANVLKTDDAFHIGGSSGKNTLDILSTDTDTGIRIGGDVNLYRSAADTLKTDDNFITVGQITAVGGLEVQSDVIFDGGRIQFGTGTNAWDFTYLKRAIVNYNPPSLAAHSGNVATLNFTSGTCVAGDHILLMGFPDPGNRGVHFFIDPIAPGNNQVTMWMFNTDSVTLDLPLTSFYFLIFGQ